MSHEEVRCEFTTCSEPASCTVIQTVDGSSKIVRFLCSGCIELVEWQCGGRVRFEVLGPAQSDVKAVAEVMLF